LTVPARARHERRRIDANFVPHFARWLGEQVEIPVRVVGGGDALEAGVVQVARTNDHLRLDVRQRLHYDAHPRDYAYRPSVDLFFGCVAAHWERAAAENDAAERILSLENIAAALRSRIGVRSE
jgi:two-component system response regulator WspF